MYAIISRFMVSNAKSQNLHKLYDIIQKNQLNFVLNTQQAIASTKSRLHINIEDDTLQVFGRKHKWKVAENKAYGKQSHTSDIQKVGKAINSCIERKDLSSAQRIFDQLNEKGLELNDIIYTTMMKGYLRARNIDRVIQLFEEMKNKRIKPTIFAFATAINACAIDGSLEKALNLFDELQNKNLLRPDMYVYSALLKVCVTAKNLDEAKRIHKTMIEDGIKEDEFTLSIMVDVYAECCNQNNGKRYFAECFELIRQMKSRGANPSICTFNSFMKLCVKGSLTREGVKLLKYVKERGLKPDVVTYTTLLDGLSKDMNFSRKEIMALSARLLEDIQLEKVQIYVRTYNSLIYISLRLEDLTKAIGYFQEMIHKHIKPNAVTYGCLIKCYEVLGDPSSPEAYLKPCFRLLGEMKKRGLAPDGEIFTSLLSACAKAKSLSKAIEVWDMLRIHKIVPEVFHYSAMIKVYLRVRKLDKAKEVFNRMIDAGIKPTKVTYITFLSYFHKRNSKAEAEKLFKTMQSLKVDPEDDCLRLLKELKVM